MLVSVQQPYCSGQSGELSGNLSQRAPAHLDQDRPANIHKEECKKKDGVNIICELELVKV